MAAAEDEANEATEMSEENVSRNHQKSIKLLYQAWKNSSILQGFEHLIFSHFPECKYHPFLLFSDSLMAENLSFFSRVYVQFVFQEIVKFDVFEISKNR